jgi:hypothetical protein
MDILEILTSATMPVITIICLCVGYVMKHWVKDMDNRIIPTVMLILGIIIAFWQNGWLLTPEILMTGMVSGLASTGLHQVFKQWLDKLG